MTGKINSVREALKYVEADFEHDDKDLAEIRGVQVKCRGCGEPAYFTVTDSVPIDMLLRFASRHAVCTEIKKTLPNIPKEDDVWELEGRFMSRGHKRLY